MTTTAAMSSTEQLAMLISAKLQLVEILARLGRQQLALVEAGEMAGLIKLLAAKQTVLSQLQIVERQLDPFRDEDPEMRAWPSAEQRSACQGQADRCNALLAEVMDLERQAETAMRRQRDVTAMALAGVQSAADARQAYGTGVVSGPVTLQVEG